MGLLAGMFRLFFSCMTRRNVAPEDAGYCGRMWPLECMSGHRHGMYLGFSHQQKYLGSFPPINNYIQQNGN